MTSLYVLGTVMAFFAAWVLRRFVFKGEGSSFVMELPPYRMPQPKYLWRRMLDRAKVFVVRAGKIIFGLSIVLWFLASYPKVDLPPELAAQAEAAEAQVGDAEAELGGGHERRPRGVPRGSCPRNEFLDLVKRRTESRR